MRTFTKHLVGVLCAGAIAPAAVAHFDVYVGIEAGAITTGGIDVDTLDYSPDVRVFGADLGEFPTPPGFGDEPGYFSDTLTPGASFAFDIVDGLRAWDGSDFDDLAAQSVTLSKGSDSATTPGTAGGFVAGFFFATADGSGHIHEHLNLELAPNNDVGIYLLSLQLRTDAPGIGTSPTFWVVLNNGEDEEVHDEAVAWAESHLVPAPAGGPVICACGVFTLLRRRMR